MRNTLVDDPVGHSFCLLRIAVQQLSRVVLHPASHRLRVVFYLVHAQRRLAQKRQLPRLQVLLGVDVLAVLSPESNQVVLLAEMSSEGLLDEDGCFLYSQVASSDQLSSCQGLYLDDRILVAIQ